MILGRARVRRLSLWVCVGVHALLVACVVGIAWSHPAPSRSVLGRLYHDVARTSGPGADFFALYHAGLNARRGVSVYEAGEDPKVTPYYYPYRYLPVLAQTLGRAATALSPRSAYVAWIVALELSLVGLIVGLRRATSDPWLQWSVTIILLLSAPYWLEMYLGQFTFVAAGLTCLTVLRYTAEHQTAPAIALSGAALLKVYPLVALPAFVRAPGGVLLSVVVMAVVALTNVPLLLGDPASLQAFWAKNFLGEPVGLDAGNHGLLFAFYLAGEAVWGPWNLPLWGAFTLFWRAGVLLTAAVLVLTTRRVSLETAAATLVLAHFVSYFQVWEHHMSGAIAAGVLLSIGLERRGTRRAVRLALCATALLALPTPFALLPQDPGAWTLAERLALPLAKAIPLVALFAVGLHGVVSGDAQGRRRAPAA